MRKITQFLSGARHDIKLALKGIVDETLLLELAGLLERGVAVTLIMEADNEARLRDDLFLFNKCLILLKKGGSIACHPSLKANLAIKDYEQSLQITADLDQHPEKEEDSSLTHHFVQEFKKLDAVAEPFLENKDDIRIRFSANDDIILKGDEISLNWEVEHAQTIIIEGIGEVASAGSRKIKPGADTIFKIGAYNASQSALKTFAVKVYDNIGIDYDLSFANRRTGQYSSLVKEDNYPHVYGVALGNKVKINWQVKDSNEVTIKPFGITKSVGEHEFLPQENMMIEIRAKILHRTFSRKIQLLVFPIKLFTDKLVKLSAGLHQELKRVPDASEIIEQVKEKQVSYSQNLTKIREAELKQYNLLVEQIQEITFDKSNNKFNLEQINANVFRKLKNFYAGKAGKAGMAGLIESIKSYYGKA
ncbi:hypothetical protein JKA74_08780 [Marivirga sp. S37H4]|uniref:Uncharacterized protein n=1 Tax=Marivirga aurantiaca TaxID=2802615 RepID=A0A934WYH9_9BACT|nr:hypothetical protein [Marivirga aurantiaca]MBK6265130.1 hypothetical protein [Marivirga aurantiaca]